jgi:hypothetical protein
MLCGVSWGILVRCTEIGTATDRCAAEIVDRSGRYRELTVPGWLVTSANAVETDFHLAVAEQDRSRPVTPGKFLDHGPLVLVDTQVDLFVLHTLFVELLLEHVGEVALRVCVEDRNRSFWSSQFLIAIPGY